MNSHANNIPSGAHHHTALAEPHPHIELFTIGKMLGDRRVGILHGI